MLRSMTFALLSIITALIFFHRQCRVVLCQCSGPPFLSDGMPRTGITEEEFSVADECRGIRNAGGKKFFLLSPCTDLFKEKNG